MISFRKADLLDTFKDVPTEEVVTGCSMIVAFQQEGNMWTLKTIDFFDANGHTTEKPWTKVAEEKFLELLLAECGFGIDALDTYYKIMLNNRDNILRIPLQRDHDMHNWTDSHGTFQTDTFNMRLFFRDYID